MKTIKQNLYFPNLSISSKKQNLVIKPFHILFLFFIFICPTSFSQDFNNQLNDDSVVVKPDYRNHLNIPEYNPALMPLDRQTSSTGVWTELNPKVPRVDYLGIHFVNKDTGWACGANGAVIKTINGGEDWIIAQTPVTNILLKINSYNGLVVIATGYDGVIICSVDGGENFVQVVSGVGSGIDLWGVQMLNDTLGWVCGLNQTLLKTTDAGMIWQPVIAGLNQHYWALDFLNEQYGMIACGGGKVLKTTDGGNSWTEYQAGDASSLYSIDIIDSLHIVLAGANGKNVYSSDGGETWIQNSRLQHDELNSIKFINTDTGYTIGTYGGESWGIRKTTNRGASWFSPPIQNLSEWELELLPDGIGYSAGSDLWINKTTGGYDNWSGLFMNRNFVDVFFTDELTGYAPDGTWTGGPLYKTTDGGNNWFGLPNFPTQVFTSTLRCVTFTDSLTGFAGSAPCRIVKTTDAGDSWHIVNRTGLTDTIGLINRFFFINPTTGWAVTTRGGIIKTTDAGENWFAQLNAGVSIIFQSIHFVDSLYGWTASLNARPYKTTNGGNNWTMQTNIDFYQTADVFFTDKDTGWITNDYTGYILYKTTNAGVNWATVTGMYQPRKFSFFQNNSHWWVYGFSHLYETINNGLTWEEITPPITVFTRFHAPVNWQGYGVGNLGYVIRYFDSSYVPVELILFEGIFENNKIILTWQTASELNNRGFYVEKSFDKVNWLNFGFVEGNGTTTNSNTYTFIDDLSLNRNPNHTLFYRLKQIDFDGSFEYSKVIEIEVLNPTDFILYQNFPNPFNPTTIIKFSIPSVETHRDASLLTTLKVYDILGNEITTLVNEEKPAGNYKVIFEPVGLASGVYFYKLASGGNIQTRKLIFMK